MFFYYALETKYTKKSLELRSDAFKKQHLGPIFRTCFGNRHALVNIRLLANTSTSHNGPSRNSWLVPWLRGYSDWSAKSPYKVEGLSVLSNLPGKAHPRNNKRTKKPRQPRQQNEKTGKTRPCQSQQNHKTKTLGKTKTKDKRQEKAKMCQF